MNGVGTDREGRRTGSRRKVIVRSLLFVCSVVILAGLTAYVSLQTYGEKVSRDLRTQARDIAAGKPFCVQVPKVVHRFGRPETRYRAARDFSDTWGLRMRGHGGYHHAVLVVGDVARPETFHWSYVEHGFVEGTYGPFPIVCRPTRDYFDSAPDEGAAGEFEFVLDGTRFNIPLKYQPEAEWPGDLLGYVIRARAPHFEPYDRECAALTCSLIFAAFEHNGKPYGIWQDMAKSWVDEDTAYGGLHHHVDARSKSKIDEYVQIDDKGRIVTAISCMSRCSHHFSHDGVTFSFDHRREELPEWRAMEGRLIALHATFTTRLDTAGR